MDGIGIVVIGILGLSVFTSKWKTDKLCRMKNDAEKELAEQSEREEQERVNARRKQEAEDFLLLQRTARDQAKAQLTHINAERQLKNLEPIRSVRDFVSHLGITAATGDPEDQRIAAEELNLLQSNDPSRSRFFNVVQLLVSTKQQRRDENTQFNDEELQ